MLSQNQKRSLINACKNVASQMREENETIREKAFAACRISQLRRKKFTADENEATAFCEKELKKYNF